MPNDVVKHCTEDLDAKGIDILILGADVNTKDTEVIIVDASILRSSSFSRSSSSPTTRISTPNRSSYSLKLRRHSSSSA